MNNEYLQKSRKKISSIKKHERRIRFAKRKWHWSELRCASRIRQSIRNQHIRLSFEFNEIDSWFLFNIVQEYRIKQLNEHEIERSSCTNRRQLKLWSRCFSFELRKKKKRKNTKYIKRTSTITKPHAPPFDSLQVWPTSHAIFPFINQSTNQIEELPWGQQMPPAANRLKQTAPLSNGATGWYNACNGKH